MRRGFERRGGSTLRLLPLLFFSVCFLAAAGAADAQTIFSISSGGLPTITGGLSGTVTGTASLTQSLAVTVNFGEVSPANSNRVVKVVVPIAIRGVKPYQVTAAAVTSFGGDPRAVQATDIGFGIQNMRPSGGNAKTGCSSPHTIRPPFANDPAANVMLNTAGRAAYPSTISNIGSSTPVLSGPYLSSSLVSGASDDAWVFDAVFAITPSFYATGNFSVTLTFSIGAGSIVPC